MEHEEKQKTPSEFSSTATCCSEPLSTFPDQEKWYLTSEGFALGEIANGAHSEVGGYSRRVSGWLEAGPMPASFWRR